MNTTILRACAFLVCLNGGLGLAEEGSLARISGSGDFIELSRQVNGRTSQQSLPLYREGTARYFTAGVGLEERAAKYPPFPLKLVFTAEGKHFLTGVSVSIQSVKGGAALEIPEDRVEGPWLFVDLAPGQYNVTAIHGGSKHVLKGVNVEAGKQQTIYLRWAKDHGLSRPLPSE